MLPDDVNNNCLSAENDGVKHDGKSEKDANTFMAECCAHTNKFLDGKPDLVENHKSLALTLTQQFHSL
jgi:hypothetical protein